MHRFCAFSHSRIIELSLLEMLAFSTYKSVLGEVLGVEYLECLFTSWRVMCSKWFVVGLPEKVMEQLVEY
jgi:hypothetical protein